MLVTEAPKDVRVFVSRARRLDPSALVRLRPGSPGNVELWTLLPIAVLAKLTVAGSVDTDLTVNAETLVARLDDGRNLPSADHQWRASLPGGTGEVIEELPSHECRRIGEAAAATLQQARGRGIGDRRLRDTLLDQVVLQVEAAEARHDIPLRLVVGLLRMGFASHGTVRVRRVGSRLGLEGVAGTVWGQAPGLTVL